MEKVNEHISRNDRVCGEMKKRDAEMENKKSKKFKKVLAF